jgi:CDGSH-type Zn-finger protein/uncharacterized Fe-S cluster protein YjdI
MAKVDEYRGHEVIVRFEGERCVHSRNCVLGNPAVFIPNAPGAWIQPDAASAEAVVALALACPSGAITVERVDGGAVESAPGVNVVRVRENGPLAFAADMRLPDGNRLRATLCRCGASKSKPYCDGSHTAAGFKATGEPATQESSALARRGGPVTVSPAPNGPLLVSGSLEVVSGTGRTINRLEKTALCRCGQSSNKPYCDGTHRKIGFQAP